MTISTTASRISYNGNGVTTVFSFPYRFLANGHLVVLSVSAAGVETTKVLSTDYTLTGAGDDAGGSVTMLAAPASGTRLIIYRDTGITQETDYISGDPFPAETHERALDRLTMIAQEIGSDADRAIKVPVGDSSSLSTTLPAAANRLDKFIVFDATTGETELSTVTQTQVASAVAAAYSAGGGTADAVLYLPDGTGAVSSSVQANMRSGAINAKLFAGAAFDGTTDDTTKIQQAITAGAGGWVYLPEGTAMCAGLTVPEDTTIFGPGILKKNANGPVLTMGKRSQFLSTIDGNGGTYTGTGVLINSGSIDNTSWRKLTGANIYDTASYCLEFSGATAGYGSQISDCRFLPLATSPGVYDTYAVKLPSNGGTTESGGNRMFANCWSFAARFADLADSENTNLTGCHGFWPLFTTGTAKCSIAGGRLNLYGASAILTGTANSVSGLTINYNIGAVLTISSGCVNCRFDSSNAIGSGATITDNSDGNTSGNEIYIPRKVYTPTWGGSGGTPSIGNGSISGSYVRRGGLCAVTIQLIIGATTNFNTAIAWTFSLPYTASRAESGSAYILDTGTTHIVGVTRTVGGDAFCKVYTTAAGGGIGYLIPMTWAVGDELVLDVEFEIQ